ncbi:helix-turn-helix transcriptional regulator [Saliphagus sp. GCM10025308]
MDAREHRALLGVLVVLGCLCAGFPSIAVADGGDLEAEAGARLGLDGSTDAGMTAGSVSDATVLTEPSVESLESTALQEDSNETDDANDTGDANESDDTGGNAANETDGTTANETGNESVITGATPPGYDELTIEVTVHENGSATWTLEYRYRLDGDENATDRWESVRSTLEAENETYLENVETNWSERVDAAATETGRDMTASGYRVSLEETSTPQETGYVRVQFLWEEFASVELNHRIRIGDAFGHLELDDRTQLIVTWPADFSAQTIEPFPNDRREQAAIWNGDETDFLEDEPFIELMVQTSESSPPEPDDQSSLPLSWLAALGLLVLAIVAVVGWLTLRNGDSTDFPIGSWKEQPEPEPSEPESTPRRQQPTPPDALLSNEERVVRLLEQHGGRMKQQEVVSTLEWTEAKTSQVVSGLREEGTIEAFRIGRENVLTLADEAESANGVAANGSDTGET